ncbi:MAG: EFR1 family ferrodoxin [Anaerovoracaceae bacterium]
MNIYEAYFSPTGTTKAMVSTIANRLEEILKTSVETIDFTLPEKRQQVQIFSKNDLVIFGVPVYAGRVPNILLKYLSTLEGGGALAVPVVLYGNRNYDDGLIELGKILETQGFHTIGAGAFIGEHSFSKILAKGRPDVKDFKIGKAFADQIGEKILKEDFSSKPVKIKGEDPIRGYYQPRDRKGNPVDIRKVKPKTNKDCVDCKLCAKVCPMGSIDLEDVSKFIGICIKCGACIKKCPKQAKYYDDKGYLYHKEELELGFSRRAEPEVFL